MWRFHVQKPAYSVIRFIVLAYGKRGTNWKRADKNDSLLHYVYKVNIRKPRNMTTEHGYKIAGKSTEVDYLCKEEQTTKRPIWRLLRHHE